MQRASVHQLTPGEQHQLDIKGFLCSLKPHPLSQDKERGVTLQGNEFCSASQCAESSNFFNNPIQFKHAYAGISHGSCPGHPKALGTINQLQELNLYRPQAPLCFPQAATLSTRVHTGLRKVQNLSAQAQNEAGVYLSSLPP